MSSLARTGGGTDVGLDRGTYALARVGTPGVGAVGLGLLLVLPLGLTDGGYFGHSFTALTLALAASTALVMIRAPERPSRALLATAAPLASLALWVALSSLWAVDEAAVELETRRCVLYATALVAVACVVRRCERAFLVSLTAALSIVAAVGLGMLAISGAPLDRYYGSLLAEPVGYPNAMGVMAATGAVLAIGLGATAGARGARGLRALAPLLVLALGLSGSRGGALALGVGLVVLVALSERRTRWTCVGSAAVALVVGGGTWGLVAVVGGAGLPLAGGVLLAGAIGAALPTPGRRAVLALVCALVGAGAVVVFVHPPATTSSFRTAYWAAALAEARERPLLGSGAGSFYLTWREHRTVQTDVRDAHSLYVETLSELGPLGLALVLVAVAVPLAAAVRRRGDPVAAVGAAGFAVFAVHAGLDWDWEMPVVTLVALGCAAALLTRGRGVSTSQLP